MPICTTTLYHFDRVTDPELKKISGMNKIWNTYSMRNGTVASGFGKPCCQRRG